MVAIWPFAISVQVILLLPKSAGTLTANSPYCRPVRKCVGCARSGPPGSMWLSGPIRMSSSSFWLRLKYPSRRLKVPSALRNHPSNAPVTPAPASRGGCFCSVWPDNSPAQTPAIVTVTRRALNTAARHLPAFISHFPQTLLRVRSRSRRFMLRGPFGVVFVRYISDVHPAVSHFVHGTIAVADPLIGIWIVLVRSGVVVPRRDVNDRSLRKHRRGVIVVDVIGHPVEVEVADVADNLRRAVRQDRRELHRLS